MNHGPLWMPEGSVRSILALGIVAAVIALAFLGRINGPDLLNLAFAAIAFYFGSKSKDGETTINAQPPSTVVVNEPPAG